MARYRLCLLSIACLASTWFAVGCSKDKTPTTPTTTTCSFSVSQPSVTTFPPEGGTGTASVTTASTCSWTATSSASFVTITQGASGSGNGTVQFTVAANTGSERTATLMIAGTSATLTQRAGSAPPPQPTGTLAAPTAKSPIGDELVDPGRPTLVVNNATATGNVGTVTYRFEVSDLDSFPSDPARTFTQDGVAQGSGTTSWTLTRDLGPSVRWFWRARATDGTTTSAYSNVERFRTSGPCTFTLSSSTASVAASGGSSTVTVTTGTTCSWTASSNAGFITVTAGASGTGTGTVTFTVAANSGAARSGTLTIAGQTVTVNQAAAATPPAMVASFQLFDPSSQSGATTECRFRSATGGPTTCTLQSTSVALGGNVIVNYAWTVRYTYGTVKTIEQSGSSPTLSITETCGGLTSTAEGVAQPLEVTLTVTDNLGATATATAGRGSQPALQVRLFTCGS